MLLGKEFCTIRVSIWTVIPSPAPIIIMHRQMDHKGVSNEVDERSTSPPAKTIDPTIGEILYRPSLLTAAPEITEDTNTAPIIGIIRNPVVVGRSDIAI